MPFFLCPAFRSRRPEKTKGIRSWLSAIANIAENNSSRRHRSEEDFAESNALYYPEFTEEENALIECRERRFIGRIRT
jgi:hypothetical protein